MPDKKWVYFRGQTSENAIFEFKLLEGTCCRDGYPRAREVIPKAKVVIAKQITNGILSQTSKLKPDSINWAILKDELNTNPIKLGFKKVKLPRPNLTKESFQHSDAPDELPWWLRSDLF